MKINGQNQFDNIEEKDLEYVRSKIKETLKNSLPENVYDSLPPSGKMLRVRLAVMLFKKFFKKLSEEHIKSLVALELVHLASLLHDDVIDHSVMRRGKETINVLFGDTTAVAVGDIVLVLAFELVEEIGIEKLRKAFLKVIKMMSVGEMLEQLNKGKPISRKTYFEIVNGKSGSLFGLSTWIPSIFKGDSNNDYYKIGEKLGQYYQVADDILDFEKPEKVGKSTMLDIKNGIISYPIILAFEKESSLVKAYEKNDWKKVYNFIINNKILEQAKDELNGMITKFVQTYSWLNNYVMGIFNQFFK
ncbi:polyprenyl synthetase family protein [Thermosipho ferrireducens]|uniref:Polyprenyl synthetase family protein n=1 Tax=Thermosipho ferrireducens TaxID=2571116 RepID=A0ABX7S6P8_9BACT|nr:polyprenyl synthetase family protein [Thermosipho ferrireducens]QTA37568.1 polyprenyl synthetase family protein [Thermosipho ferrireducens]